MKACEVIAYHSKEGKITPLKIKIYEGDDASVFVIKSCVELTQNYRQKDILRFRCKITVNEVLREIELIFNKTDMTWFIKE